MAADRPASDAASVRRWEIVRCTSCGHQWDEENPDDEVCDCLDRKGSRTVILISAGATNA